MSTSKNLLLVYTERFMATALTFFAFMILARLLSPEEVGIYAVGAALLVMAQALRDFGQANYVLKEKDLTDEKIAAVQTVAFITGWSAAVLIFFAASPVADFYDEPRLRDVVRLLSLNFFLLPFGSPTLALLRREMDFYSLFKINLASVFVQSAVSVGLAYHEFSYMSLVIGSVAGTAVTSILALAKRRSIAFMRPTTRHLAPVLRFGILASGSSIIGKLALSANDIVIGKVIGFAPAALYSRGQSLALLVHEQLVNGAFKVLVTTFASRYRDGEPLKPGYLQSVSYLTVAAWPIYAYVGLNSGELLLLFFGDQWISAAGITSILCIAFAAAVLARPGPQILIAVGDAKKLLHLESIQQSIRLAIVIVAVQFSLEALAYSMIGFYIVAIVLYHALAIRPYVKVGAIAVARECAISAIVTSIAAGGVVVSQYALAEFELPLLVRLGFIFFCSGIAWLLAIAVVRHPIRADVVQLAKTLRTSLGRA